MRCGRPGSINRVRLHSIPRCGVSSARSRGLFFTETSVLMKSHKIEIQTQREDVHARGPAGFQGVGAGLMSPRTMPPRRPCRSFGSVHLCSESLLHRLRSFMAICFFRGFFFFERRGFRRRRQPCPGMTMHPDPYQEPGGRQDFFSRCRMRRLRMGEGMRRRILTLWGERGVYHRGGHLDAGRSGKRKTRRKPPGRPF